MRSKAFSSLLFLLFIVLAPSALAKTPNAKEILDRIDDMWRGSSSAAIFSMEIRTENWQRTLTMQSFTLGKDYSLIIIKKPKKERGTATLRRKQDMWNYLPKVDDTIRIPPSMLLSSWMGSHFTNDDLVKESRMSEDYTFSITFSGTRKGEEIYELTLIPKPEVPVVWGKIVVEVRQRDYMPLVQYYYDEKNKLARQAVFSDFAIEDGRLIAKEMKIEPASETKDKVEEYTLVKTQKIKFNIGVDSDFFSHKNMSRR